MAQIGLLAQMLMAMPASDGREFVNLERLSDRVTLAYWVGTDRRCNLTAIRTQKGLVLIDTEMSPRIMEPIKARLEQELGRSDWAYVINTHAHDSHPGGNSLFKGAVIVGHENLAKDMEWIVRRQTDSGWRSQELERAEKLVANLRTALSKGAEHSVAQMRMIQGEIRFWELHSQDLREGYEVVRPTLTFKENQTLALGDIQLNLVFFGKGHSLSDTLIFIPQERLLVTGGVVYQRGQFPEIGEATEVADLRRFLVVLNRFLASDVPIDHVIPSHSPPLVKMDLAPVRDYYQRIVPAIRGAQAQGLNLEQAMARFPSTQFPAFTEKPAGFWAHGMHERNLRNLWRILQAEGKP